MGETDLDLHDSYYADLTVEREDAMLDRQSAGAYSWVNPSRSRRSKSDTEPHVTEFDADVPTTKITRPETAASIEEAVQALLSSGPPPARRKERDVDPCNCVYCKESRENHVFYVQYDGSTVLRPLTLVVEVAEVAGADPMRFCAMTDKVIDQDAPVIAPWTVENGCEPICCKPLRRAHDVDRVDIPPFGDTIAFSGAKGYLLAKRCPWCGTIAAEIIGKRVGR